MLIKKTDLSKRNREKNIQIWWMCIKKSPRSVSHALNKFIIFYIRATKTHSAGIFLSAKKYFTFTIHFSSHVPSIHYDFSTFITFFIQFSIITFQAKKWFDVVVLAEEGPIPTRWILLEKAQRRENDARGSYEVKSPRNGGEYFFFLVILIRHFCTKSWQFVTFFVFLLCKVMYLFVVGMAEVMARVLCYKKRWYLRKIIKKERNERR